MAARGLKCRRAQTICTRWRDSGTHNKHLLRSRSPAHFSMRLGSGRGSFAEKGMWLNCREVDSLRKDDLHFRADNCAAVL